MSFATPQLLWLCLLAPAVALIAAWMWRRRLQAATAWAGPALWRHLDLEYRPGRLLASIIFLALSVLGTSLALARPRWGVEEELVERQGVDVVFILDTSLSMAAFDVRPNRLDVAQSLIRRMVQAMPENRVALVEAEGTGVVLAPLTVDGAVLDLLLDTVEPGSLPTPGTELATALDTALELFPEGDGKHRVVVLMSDGEDHGGGLSSRLGRLHDEGVVVHTFGIGTSQGSPLPLPGGKDNDYKRDRNGQVVISRLNEELLEGLARETGGLYLRAGSAALDPTPVVARIAAMEKKTFDSTTLSTQQERFQWPLALAAAALVLYLARQPFAARPSREVAK